MNAVAATVAEATLVLATGLALGLTANALDERGLDLGRDHFPKAPVTPAATPDATPDGGTAATPREEPAPEPTTPAEDPAPAPDAPVTPPDDAPPPAAEATAALVEEAPLDPAIVARLAEKGLQAMTLAEALTTWQDPMRQYEAFVFVDARDDLHYEEGHIPGAWPFDPFRPDAYLPDLMPLLPTSMKLVVYCNGGDCEDSESAAIQLLQWGADASRLFVFAGGITAWRDAGLPVEKGARNSGDIEGAVPGADGGAAAGADG